MQEAQVCQLLGTQENIGMTSNKYLAFLNNYDIRPCKAQYLWWYYYLQDHLPNTHFILNEDYLNPNKNRWEIAKYETAPYKYKNPAELSPKNLTVLPRVTELPELREEEVPSVILKKVMLEPIPSIVDAVSKVLETEKITASISWCNNASVEYACRVHKIPAIHNESGALRSPRFKDTCYFDFSGVNGNTEFDQRFNYFKYLVRLGKVKIFSREELLRIVTPKANLDYILGLDKIKPTYECGVAMQVDVDTNLIAFNKGFQEADVVNMAAKKYNDSLLIRNHPLSSIGYIKPASIGLGKVDDSANSLEFLVKCKRIYTLNSSVAFEAMLFGREVKILGDNPFYSMQFMDKETRLLALNFAIFGYLMPTKRLYDEKYYNFRMQCLYPASGQDEEVIYNEGQRYWLENTD